MEHVLIVKLGEDMSPNAVEELKHAISMWRGVRGVEWQEAAQHSVQRTCAACGGKGELMYLGEKIGCGVCFGTGTSR